MIISHPAFKEYQKKPLTEHLENVARGCSLRIQRLSLDTHTISAKNLADLAFRVGLLHDLGKASSYFQTHIRGGKPNALSKHSLISAIVLYYDLIRDSRFGGFALLAFKAVQRHHGNLSTFGTERLDDAVLIDTSLKIYVDVTKQIQTDADLNQFFLRHHVKFPELNILMLKDLGNELEYLEPVKNADDAIERFIIQNLLFSVLIDADKYDAARIDHTPDQTLQAPLNYSPYKHLDTFEQTENELNDIRSKLTKVAGSTLPDSGNCFAMSAPTGSGKTFACLAFADSMQKHSQCPRRVLYCLPYTSIIDQNHNEIAKVIQANGNDAGNPDFLLKHHHLMDFSRENRDENYDLHDYMNDNLVANSWNAACVVSTFVQLFHSLIGYRNSMVRKLHNIVNSIILLDEVQSLPPKYYPLLRHVFRVLATRFDTIILTCTATQPFIYEPATFVEISPANLFDHPVFKRVELRINSQPRSLSEFVEELNLDGAPNALFVMNTKRSAIELYRLLKQIYDDFYEIHCLTTFHTPITRIDKIAEIKTALNRGKPVILVSTQLIEAGVDISFQRVYRDFGPLDSVIQVAGRCNRHGEYGNLGGKMVLLNLHREEKTYASYVYDSYLLYKTKAVFGDKQRIESLEFPNVIQAYYRSLEFSADANALMNAIKEMNYDQDYRDQMAIQRFKLIEDQYCSQSLYILMDQIAQDAMELLIESRRLLAGMIFADNQEESILRLQIKRSYHVLSQYQLSLLPGDIRSYDQRMSFFHKLDDSVYYIPMDYVDQAYSYETGFLPEPSSSGSVISI